MKSTLSLHYSTTTSKSQAFYISPRTTATTMLQSSAERQKALPIICFLIYLSGYISTRQRQTLRTPRQNHRRFTRKSRPHITQRIRRSRRRFRIRQTPQKNRQILLVLVRPHPPRRRLCCHYSDNLTHVSSYKTERKNLSGTLLFRNASI